MPQTQNNLDKNNSRLSTKLSDIDQAQSRLVELSNELKEKNNIDPVGTFTRRAAELENIYNEIKSGANQTLASGEQALEAKKAEFLSGWQELKKAAEQAKDKFSSVSRE